MIYRIDICPGGNARDARTRGASLRRQAEALGIGGIQAISVTDLYFLEGPRLDDTSVRRLAETLLCDPVVEEFALARLGEPRSPDRIGSLAAGRHTVEVALLPGVTDSVAEHLLEGALLVGIQGLERAATGRRYAIDGEVDEDGINRLAAGLLSNEVIQTYAVDRPVDPPFVPGRPADGTVEIIPLTAADAQGLEAISRERRLSLDLAEMRAIQAYFQKAGREPTDVELEMLAQTWSEHCVHKTFKALISYEEFDRGRRAANPFAHRSIPCSTPTSAARPRSSPSRGCDRRSSTTPGSSPSTSISISPSRSRRTTIPRPWNRSAAPIRAWAASSEM